MLFFPQEKLALITRSVTCIATASARNPPRIAFAATDILSDSQSRALYDAHGLDMGSMKGAESGRGNARDAWEEFKPFRRENKHTRARGAVQAEASDDDEGQNGSTAERCL